MNDLEFPPFVPAKPKGGVAKEIAASKPIVQKPDDPGPHPLDDPLPYHTKAKRKPTEPKLEAEPKFKRKKRKPRAGTIPLDALPALAGLHVLEAEQVVTFCEALQTHSKASRTRIVEALGKIFA
jgi:hypothetical protein